MRATSAGVAEPAVAPVAVRELVGGERAADRLVVATSRWCCASSARKDSRRGRASAPGSHVSSRGSLRARAPRPGAHRRASRLARDESARHGSLGLRRARRSWRSCVTGIELTRSTRSSVGDGDLADDGVAERAVAEAKPDAVVHAAARIGVVRCDEEPLLALRSNVLATLMSRVPAPRTARGSPTSRPRTSTGSPRSPTRRRPPRPKSLYALTKRWGEQTAELYAPDGLVVLRLANPYGPGLEPGQGKGALPSMLWQAAVPRANPGLPRRDAHVVLDRRRRARRSGSCSRPAGTASSTSAPTPTRSR